MPERITKAQRWLNLVLQFRQWIPVRVERMMVNTPVYVADRACQYGMAHDSIRWSTGPSRSGESQSVRFRWRCVGNVG